MIAEQVTPPIPVPVPPLEIQPVVTEGNSDADVRARFNKVMESQPKVEVQDISTAKNPITGEPVLPTEKKETPKVEGKEGGIPDEFFQSKPTEQNEFDKLISEEVKGHTTNEHFKKVKAAAAREVENLRKELAEVRTKLPKDDYVPEKTAKQLADLQKRLEERDELINRKYVEESPEFKEQFVHQKEIVTKQLTKLGKEFGVSDDILHQLLHASPKRQAEILENQDLSSTAVSRINTLLEQHDQINAKQEDYLSDWKARQAELEQSHQAQEDKERVRIKGLYDKAFEDVVDSLKDHELFKPRGDEKFDSQTKELIENARKRYNAESSTPHSDAEAFIAAELTHRATAMMEKAIGLYRETKKELDELKAAGPGGGHGSETTKDDPTKNMTADERARWTFNTAVGLARNGA